MQEPPDTLEGWYCLHDVRRLSGGASGAEAGSKEWAINGLLEVEPAQGTSGVFRLLGHKGDVLFVHLRPTLEELLAIQDRSRLALQDWLEPSFSFLSVTELSLYEAYARAGEGLSLDEIRQQPFARQRLYPSIPEMPYFSFYPMNKRRGEVDNWYALPMEERRRMMKEHGSTGRKYHGKVQQMITGATGLDDWEWGVTLFATDPLHLKKLVYEMRFDEVSARYAEFGQFYTGIRATAEEIAGL